MKGRLAHIAFAIYEIEDRCTWPGTKWDKSGKIPKLLTCGMPTVGAGLFCDPSHSLCEIHSVCERHSRGHRTEDWKDIED